MIARSGSVGKAFIIQGLHDVAVFASYLIRVIPDTANILPNFLILFCQSTLYWNQIKSSAKGSVLHNINAKSLGNLKVPLPPLEEQKRIVAKVEALFEQIDLMVG